MFFKRLPSPLGFLLLFGTEDRLSGVYFVGRPHAAARPGPDTTERDVPVLLEASRQLADYFAGLRRAFDLPLDLAGTPFQNRVWRALADIPYGETRTYAEQTAALGSPPTAIRAVARANALNPLSIVLPCHRVVGSDGSLTGYAGGLAAKRTLLDLESSAFRLAL